MFKITKKLRLAENIIQIDIQAPDIAKKRKPGQFLLIIPSENSERVPFTIMDSDIEKGTVSVIIQVVGTATHRIDKMNEGEYLYGVVGPLGKPTEIKKTGTVVCIGGGVGIAVVYPIAKAMKEVGNKVISIIGGRNKSLILLEKEMTEISDEIYFTTDDGSYGIKGFVTGKLKELMDAIKIDEVAAIGPAIMMKNIAELTKQKGIKTIVSLNSIMIDGTGMCGSCRVTVGGAAKFVCVDGPEFDGHLVDWDNLMKRQRAFVKHEKCSLDRYISEN
ncbi:MAG TPA: sulfide/dihydroorotate dehydrogenase-like FAD/NAD-binding protein [bacterium]|nr:sulfide/dihydroorotate dehydrogenase-like FAD/NAD-binding protein [bacterium]HPN31880.1 sulfide/dihydroorotate dehydrogenase-like FAD/NAD-binding protein [bacterium]